MTESTHPEELRCRWCGERFDRSPGPGRPAIYCRPSHRQRAYESRRLAATRRLGSDEVLLSRSTYQAIRDVLFQIEAALEDTRSDLGLSDDVGAYREAFDHLSDAAREVKSLSIEPRAVG